ncbi:hypothetical protein D9615_009122 [Tricholomella constricta]|uniref:Serine aminopeptidase S33 domain-containing protein n=1 Tax=Tricholomella constricta TaxID=117010 RepID=A0A8H5H079_9AGAR|nr:hypothetical protein D9615_009122 [Tricholomella constricta]
MRVYPISAAPVETSFESGTHWAQPAHDYRAGKRMVSAQLTHLQTPISTSLPRAPPSMDAPVNFLCMYLFLGQKYLVYPAAYEPRPYGLFAGRTSTGNLSYDKLTVTTPDGVKLACFVFAHTEESLVKDWTTHDSIADDLDFFNREHPEYPKITEAASKARATIIYYHKTLDRAVANLCHAASLFKLGYNVVVAEYRGFGESEGGKANEKGLRIDGQAVFDTVLRDPYLSKTHLVLYGSAVGGAVAIDVASRNPSRVSRVIVANTFTSIPSALRHNLPILGHLLCIFSVNQWNSGKRLKHIPVTTPILMLSARRDRIVNYRSMEALWEAAQHRGEQDASDDSKPRPVNDVFKPFFSAGHESLEYRHDYWKIVDDFLKDLEDAPPVPKSDS